MCATSFPWRHCVGARNHRAAPATDAFLAACPAQRNKAPQQAQCLDALADLAEHHLIMLLLNLAMVCAPIVKLAYGQAGTAAGKTQ